MLQRGSFCCFFPFLCPFVFEILYCLRFIYFDGAETKDTTTTTNAAVFILSYADGHILICHTDALEAISPIQLLVVTTAAQVKCRNFPQP